MVRQYSLKRKCALTKGQRQGLKSETRRVDCIRTYSLLLYILHILRILNYYPSRHVSFEVEFTV